METNPEDHSGFGRFEARGTPEQGDPASFGLASPRMALGRKLIPPVGWQRGLLVWRGRARERLSASAGDPTLALIAVVGVLAAAAVAYAAAANPHSSPAGPAGWLARAMYVLAPAVVGLGNDGVSIRRSAWGGFSSRSRRQRRCGR